MVTILAMKRVAIVGLGFMGRVHYAAWSKIPEASVVAVSDADPKRASGDLSGGWANLGGDFPEKLPMDRIRGTTSWKELFSWPDIDIIDICLPTPAHLEVVLAALATGKNVMCEKPLARSSADAEKIAEAAGKAAGFFMPAMCMRFWGEWEWLRQAVMDKRFGKLRSAAFQRLGSCPAGWYRDGTLSGGGILDLHIHDVDFIYHLLGRPDALFSNGYSYATGEIDHLTTHFIYNDGPMVTAEGSWANARGWPFAMRYVATFDDATVDFDMSRKPTLRVTRDGKSEGVEHGGSDGYVAEARYFLDCVEKGRPRPA